MSKGSSRRPSQTGREEENLRYCLAIGKITFLQFERRYNELLKEGKVTRSGRRINETTSPHRNRKG